MTKRKLKDNASGPHSMVEATVYILEVVCRDCNWRFPNSVDERLNLSGATTRAQDHVRLDNQTHRAKIRQVTVTQVWLETKGHDGHQGEGG